MAPADSDVVLALPAVVKPVRHVRSTLILASIDTVRKRDLFAAYERALPARHKEALLTAVAATWIDLDAALAHYAACDTLGLTAEQQAQSGRSTFDAARGTILGTAVRMGARSAGITPWTALPLFQRFWERGLDGGGVSVVRVGPKDAHVTVVQCPLIISPYFRNGLRGLHVSLVELFCTRAYVTERRHASADGILFRVQWA